MEGAVPGGGDGLSDDGDPALRLIETLAWDGTGPLREARHLDRMAAGAARLGWPFDRRAAAAALRAGRRGPARLRLTLGRDGVPAVEEGPLPAPIGLWRVRVHPVRLRSGDPWLGVKSTRRALYDAARAALPPDLDEWLFLNERGEVCEGTITTLFFDRGNGWRTPPLSCGCLPGVLRAERLERGAAREEVLRARDLGRVRLALGNALRGLAPARLEPGGPG